MKTKFCDECVFATCGVDNKLVCLKEHKPKFYMTRSPLDENYGYKRRCKDFEREKDED